MAKVMIKIEKEEKESYQRPVRSIARFGRHHGMKVKAPWILQGIMEGTRYSYPHRGGIESVKTRFA